MKILVFCLTICGTMSCHALDNKVARTKCAKLQDVFCIKLATCSEHSYKYCNEQSDLKKDCSKDYKITQEQIDLCFSDLVNMKCEDRFPGTCGIFD